MTPEEHRISLEAERRLEEEWERYCEEGTDGNEYDQYEEAEARWELQDER